MNFIVFELYINEKLAFNPNNYFLWVRKTCIYKQYKKLPPAITLCQVPLWYFKLSSQSFTRYCSLKVPGCPQGTGPGPDLIQTVQAFLSSFATEMNKGVCLISRRGSREQNTVVVCLQVQLKWNLSLRVMQNTVSAGIECVHLHFIKFPHNDIKTYSVAHIIRIWNFHMLFVVYQ